MVEERPGVVASISDPRPLERPRMESKLGAQPGPDLDPHPRTGPDTTDESRDVGPSVRVLEHGRRTGRRRADPVTDSRRYGDRDPGSSTINPTDTGPRADSP